MVRNWNVRGKSCDMSAHVLPHPPMRLPCPLLSETRGPSDRRGVESRTLGSELSRLPNMHPQKGSAPATQRIRKIKKTAACEDSARQTTSLRCSRHRFPKAPNNFGHRQQQVTVRCPQLHRGLQLYRRTHQLTSEIQCFCAFCDSPSP